MLRAARMPTILLVRHAQASYGEAVYDRLSDLGRDQVAHLRHALGQRGLKADRFVSGALRRQVDTAEALAAATGGDVVVDQRWDEYDAADLLAHHSSSDASLEARTGEPSEPPVSSRDFQAVLDDALRRWIAAGEGSATHETWPAFRGRVAAALAGVGASLVSGETAVVSTSAGVIAAAATIVLELPATALIPLNHVGINAGVTTLTHGRRGTTLITFNEHAHLPRALVTYR
jgi:broad specificity phosphatase PhoE